METQVRFGHQGIDEIHFCVIIVYNGYRGEAGLLHQSILPRNIETKAPNIKYLALGINMHFVCVYVQCVLSFSRPTESRWFVIIINFFYTIGVNRASLEMKSCISPSLQFLFCDSLPREANRPAHPKTIIHGLRREA